MSTAPALYLYSFLNLLIAIFYNLASLFPVATDKKVSFRNKHGDYPLKSDFLILAYFSVSVKSQLPHNYQKTREACVFLIKV